MPRKKKTASAQSANTAVTNPGAIFNNISLPTPTGEEAKGPKIETCEVGMFRLPGVKVDLNQYSEQEVAEMMTWARENSAYVAEDKGLFSWRKESLRDWFVLRWG